MVESDVEAQCGWVRMGPWAHASPFGAIRPYGVYGPCPAWDADPGLVQDSLTRLWVGPAPQPWIGPDERGPGWILTWGLPGHKPWVGWQI